MTIDLKLLQENLCDKLVNTGWDTKMRFFLRSSEFTDLLLSLYTEALDQRRFTPALKNVFRNFELCKFNDTKIVFVNQEPYDNPLLNNGLALSTNEVKLTPGYLAMLASYDFIGKGVKEGDLISWAKQGILLLNTSLTTQVQSPGKHWDIWQPFMNYFFDAMNRQDNIIWLFFGSSVYADSIDNKTHTKLFTQALPIDKNDKWQNGEVFFKINELLVNKFAEIVW